MEIWFEFNVVPKSNFIKLGLAHWLHLGGFSWTSPDLGFLFVSVLDFIWLHFLKKADTIED